MSQKTEHNVGFLSGLEKTLKNVDGNMQEPLPVHKWNPEFCGDIDMRIASDGSWYYMKTPIGRQSLVRLFSRILKRETDGRYYLVTPVEKVGIVVDDAPFVVIAMEISEANGIKQIGFITNVGEKIIVNKQHYLRFQEQENNGGMKPYVHVRDGLEALVSRSVFYDLVAIGKEYTYKNELYFGVWSDDLFFPIQPSKEVFEKN